MPQIEALQVLQAREHLGIQPAVQSVARQNQFGQRRQLGEHPAGKAEQPAAWNVVVLTPGYTEVAQVRQPGERSDRHVAQVGIEVDDEPLQIRQAVEDALRQAVYQSIGDDQCPQVRQALEVAPLQRVQDHRVVEAEPGVVPTYREGFDRGQVRGGDVRAVADAADRSQQHRPHAFRARADAAALSRHRLILRYRQRPRGHRPLGGIVSVVANHARRHLQLTVADIGKIIRRGDGDRFGAAGPARRDGQFVVRGWGGNLVVVGPGGRRRLHRYPQSQSPRQETVECRRHFGRTAVFRNRRWGKLKADDRRRVVLLDGQRNELGDLERPGDRPGRHVDFPLPGIPVVIGRGDRYGVGAPACSCGNGQRAVLADREVERSRPGLPKSTIGFGERVHQEPGLVEPRARTLRPHPRDAVFADRGGRKVERHPPVRRVASVRVHRQVRGLDEAVARVQTRRSRQRADVYESRVRVRALVADPGAGRDGKLTGFRSVGEDVRHLDVEWRRGGHVGGEAPGPERHDGYFERNIAQAKCDKWSRPTGKKARRQAGESVAGQVETLQLGQPRDEVRGQVFDVVVAQSDSSQIRCFREQAGGHAPDPYVVCVQVLQTGKPGEVAGLQVDRVVPFFRVKVQAVQSERADGTQVCCGHLRAVGHTVRNEVVDPFDQPVAYQLGAPADALALRRRRHGGPGKHG